MNNGLFANGFRRTTMKNVQEAQYARAISLICFDSRFPLCVPCQRVCVLPATLHGQVDDVGMQLLVQLLLAGPAEAVYTRKIMKRTTSHYLVKAPSGRPSGTPP